jgi:hypothetical protein
MKDATPPSPCPSPYGATCNAYKVTWAQPNPAGVTVKVFAVTKCFAKPHCFKAGIFISAADLVQVGSAAASTGSVTFVVGGGQSDGDGWMKSSGGKTLFVYSVVVQATSSASGESLLMCAWTW